MITNTEKQVYLVCSGDLRLSANLNCWAAQQEMEELLGMHATLKGVSRDQMMASHQSNHIQVVYTTDQVNAHQACRIKAAALDEMGIKVHSCGDVAL